MSGWDIVKDLCRTPEGFFRQRSARTPDLLSRKSLSSWLWGIDWKGQEGMEKTKEKIPVVAEMREWWPGSGGGGRGDG